MPIRRAEDLDSKSRAATHTLPFLKLHVERAYVRNGSLPSGITTCVPLDELFASDSGIDATQKHRPFFSGFWRLLLGKTQRSTLCPARRGGQKEGLARCLLERNRSATLRVDCRFRPVRRSSVSLCCVALGVGDKSSTQDAPPLRGPVNVSNNTIQFGLRNRK